MSNLLQAFVCASLAPHVPAMHEITTVRLTNVSAKFLKIHLPRYFPSETIYTVHTHSFFLILKRVSVHRLFFFILETITESHVLRILPLVSIFVLSRAIWALSRG